jgi:hypothetical protein
MRGEVREEDESEETDAARLDTMVERKNDGCLDGERQAEREQPAMEKLQVDDFNTRRTPSEVRTTPLDRRAR